MKRISVLIATLILAACGEGDNKTQPDYIKGQYIVVMKRSEVSAARARSALEEDLNLKNPKKIFSGVIQGGVYHLEDDQVDAVKSDSRVAYVEQDQRIHVESVQANAPWGLDRIDQGALPLNQIYNAPDGGASVNAYVIDTGILMNHQEFGGRARSGADFVDNDGDATDCNGHGTHVAGTIGGATYGVAKSVSLIGVRVLDCDGSGSFSGVIAGIEWVTAHHVKPAVANLSLGGGASQAVDDAINAAINAGVTVVVAAGNENQDACNTSPARVPNAITVGATTRADQRSSFSNFGTCVDIFAPGTDILSAWFSSPNATNTISGTSMASPHTTGAAALYLAQHPSALPSEVAQGLKAAGVQNKLSTVGAGSPNLLLNINFGGNPPPEPEPEPEPQPVLQNGVALGGLAGEKDSEKFYSISVPAGANELVIEISGGSGDADLYVKSGIKPSSTVYNCRPFLGGSSETCTISSPSTGVYHVLVRGYSAYSGLSLKATYHLKGSNPNPPCAGCKLLQGNLKAKGDFKYAPGDEFQAPAGTQQYILSGPAGTDFDLYLYKKNGSSWSQVASAVKSSSSESLSYSGAAGTYRLKVISYAGAGAFELWYK